MKPPIHQLENAFVELAAIINALGNSSQLEQSMGICLAYLKRQHPDWLYEGESAQCDSSPGHSLPTDRQAGFALAIAETCIKLKKRQAEACKLLDLIIQVTKTQTTSPLLKAISGRALDNLHKIRPSAKVQANTVYPSQGNWNTSYSDNPNKPWK